MTDSYFDIDNRHQIYLGRLATYLINEYPNKNLTASYKLAREILIDAGDITSISKLNKVTAAIDRALSIPAAAMWSDLTIEMQDMAVNEAAFSAKTLNDINGVSLAIPAASKVIKAIDNTLMTLTSGASVNSGVWAEYTASNTASVIKVYNAQIKAGYAQSETLNQMTKRLRTVTDGILKNNAEALVRTGVSHYANESRQVMFDANKDIIKNKYANTVFDNRRSLQCSGYAAHPVYAADDPKAPSFPAHFGCRSNWLALIGDQKHPFGDRPAVGGVDGEAAAARYDKRMEALNKRRDNPNIEGQTASQVKYRGRKDADTFKAGAIKGSTGADEWLREQPEWFQNSNLGKKRADLFRSGVGLDKFTDLTGKPLTLKELKASGV